MFFSLAGTWHWHHPAPFHSSTPLLLLLLPLLLLVVLLFHNMPQFQIAGYHVLPSGPPGGSPRSHCTAHACGIWQHDKRQTVSSLPFFMGRTLHGPLLQGWGIFFGSSCARDIVAVQRLNPGTFGGGFTDMFQDHPITVPGQFNGFFGTTECFKIGQLHSNVGQTTVARFGQMPQRMVQGQVTFQCPQCAC